MEFEEVYTIYFKSVYHYIWQLSGSEQLAEELTSETFFKAMDAIDRFRGDCDLRVWLCQIAKNAYFSYCRRHKAAPSLNAPDRPEPASGELSFREIGELFGKTDNWACVTYHRARKMIQRTLEEMGYEP